MAILAAMLVKIARRGAWRRRLLFLASFFAALWLGGPWAEAGETVAGKYRCWMMNVGGRGGRCTSPPIILRPNGTYEMSKEQGTYTVKGDRLTLSESKIRGAGRLEGNRIVFQYKHGGLDTTVTYLRP